jgi:eukaryotic-like serine/threonine-protein kinase
VETRVIAGRYAVLGEIGRGGMGVVWLAEDRTIGRRVAVKELAVPGGVPESERTVLRERVLREARAAGRLNDPGVVTVYDVLDEAGGTFIVMELVEAPTLAALVRQRGPLPAADVARLGERLLAALEAAHASGVVHRDVKPGNVLVPDNGRVKLTDFGIAQALDDARLTASGIVVGSPAYLAPERVKGADADTRSDLWALGAVLFFAVEGYSPFERSSAAETMQAVGSELPYLTRCHGPLAAAITGLLNATPSARPGVEQVRGLLAQAALAPPVNVAGTAAVTGPTALGPATMVAPRPVPRRRWLRPLGAVAAALVLFAGGLLTGWLTTGSAGADLPANQDATLTYGTGGDLAEFDWDEYSGGDLGICLSGVVEPGRRINRSAQVNCDEPHELQVFDWRTVYGIPDETSDEVNIGFPGAEPLAAYAERLCALSFGSQLVTDENKATELRFRAVVPAERAWSEVRTIHCVLYRADGGQLTEPVVNG